MAENLNDVEITSTSSSSTCSSTNASPKASTNFSLIHYNAQSLNKKKINIIQAESGTFDVIAVSETWFNPESADLCLLGFHNPVRKDRSNKIGGGVALYIKNSHSIKPRPDLDSKDLEAVWCEIRIQNKKALVCAIYREPRSPVAHWDLIEDSIEQAKLTGIDHIFILGDLNEDVLKPNSKISSLCNDFHLTQLLTEPTHDKALIDVILTTSPDIINDCGTLPPSLSKHKAIYATTKFKLPREKSYKRKVYLYDRANWEDMKLDLQNTEWENIFREANIDDMAKKWTEKYLEVIHRHIPTKIVRIDQNDAPWMSTKVKKYIKKRNRAYRKAKSTNQVKDWDKFKGLRNTTAAMIEEAKASHTRKLEDKINRSCSSNDKIWWKLVKQFLNKKGSSRRIPPLMENDESISDDKAKADIFNKYFAEQGTLDTSNAELLDMNFTTHNPLERINLSFLDVEKVLLNLKTNTASSPDEVSTRMLKATARQISPSLARLFNFSLRTATYPTLWKEANVTPIYKKADAHNKKNYRPISLLSCVGKAMERCIHERIFHHFTENEKLSRLQAAYTPGSSTVTQLIEIYHIIQQALDNGKDIRFTFCDCSKAFDRVWHDGAIYKLKKMGIEGELLAWLQHYLTNRSQRVVINGTASETTHLSAGVPQGSILGPLIFLVYINDITDAVRSNIRLYADDASLFIEYDDPQSAVDDLNEDLARIQDWANRWFVTFNPEKTESLVFSRKHRIRKPPLEMNGTIIKEVREHSHLGIILQQNGKWTSHIKEITSRAKKRTDILRGLMYSLNRKSIEKLYLTYIRPILEYGCALWDNCNDYEKIQLEKVQLMGLRAITGAKKGTSHSNLYFDTGLEKLSVRRRRQKLLMFYKMNNQLAPSLLCDLVPESTEERTTYSLRSSQNKTLPKTTTKAMQSSFIPSTVQEWNALPIDVRLAGTVEEFKRKITPKMERPPSYYYGGERKYQIQHTRIRLQRSDLSEDLFDVGLSDSPMCRCGEHVEDAEHFLSICRLYQDCRDHISDAAGFNIFDYDVDTLLFGDKNFDIETNREIFELIQYYIELTKRFN